MRKVFGDIQFDYAIDFSGYAFFWGNLVLATNAKKNIFICIVTCKMIKTEQLMENDLTTKI